VTTQLRRRNFLYVFGVEVVAVVGEEELEVEGRESSEPGFVEPSASISVSVCARNLS